MTTTPPSASHSWVQQCTTCGTVHDRDKLHDGLCHDCVANKLQAAMAELDLAYKYASRLFHQRAPECNVLPDLIGVLTQLDNMLTGMVRKEEVKLIVEALEGAKVLALCLADERNGGTFMDNNENALRITEALRIAKKKGFA